MATMNGTGQGGKSFQDRQIAADVRSLGLYEINHVLIANGRSPEAEKIRTKRKLKITRKDKNPKLYAAVLTRLGGTLLPKLNHHMGPDDGPMEVLITKFAKPPKKS